MKRGAVLLLDEVDLGTIKIMCLQSVLEGKGVFLKKINTWVHPKEGFMVGLTGNTKGRGDETGKFVGTNVLNEAFIDRTAYTIEQEYPKPEVEEKIIVKVLEKNGSPDPQFARLLVRWADQNRRAYAEGAIEDVITTRRLIHAATIYSVFEDRLKAVEGVLTRFDQATRSSLFDLYKKLDASSDGGENTEALGAAPAPNTATTAPSNAVPF
jgi:MoxR-like ATPase